MKNFYDLLQLDEKSSISEINNKLIKMERNYKARMTVDVEKSTEMLQLISEAKEIFVSDETKEKYDNDLLNSNKTDPQTDNDAVFENLKNEVYDLHDNKQYDLAKNKAEIALKYYSPEKDDGFFYYILSNIYRKNENYNQAIDYINKAIMFSPKDFSYHFYKAEIYYYLAKNAFDMSNFTDCEKYATKEREVLEYLLKIIENYDNHHRYLVFDELACSYYLLPKANRELAKNYADLAISECKLAFGDGWDEEYKKSNSQQVYQWIKEDSARSNEVVRTRHTEGGGCYIATCVYGTYDCPEVWLLRRYRDYYLSTFFFGRLFIKLYYAISPTLVSVFGKKDWFISFFKNKIDKKVIKLRKYGYLDGPYFDKK